MRSSKAQPSSRSTDRRYSARYLILIYRETRPHFDPLEIQRLVAREQGKCTIVRQADSNYLAFVDFAGKRFQTRNLGLFDIQGYRPKWIHVTSSPWRNLEKMMAQGHVLWNGISPRPQKQPSPRKRGPGKEPASSSSWELVGSATSEASLQELLQKEMDSEQSRAPEIQLDCVPLVGGETEMARNVQYWQDGYRAGYKAAILNIHQPMSNPS